MATSAKPHISCLDQVARATCNKHEHTPDADMSMFLTAQPFCKKVESPHEAPRGAKLKKDFDQEMHAGLRAGYMYLVYLRKGQLNPFQASQFCSDRKPAPSWAPLSVVCM